MPVTVSHQPAATHLVLSMTGFLTSADYEQHVPSIEGIIERYDRMDMLVHMIDFQGWRPGAKWEDLKISAEHRGEMKRIAVVGEKRWRQWMIKLSRPFDAAKVRFFGPQSRKAAERWLREGMPNGGGEPSSDEN